MSKELKDDYILVVITPDLQNVLMVTKCESNKGPVVFTAQDGKSTLFFTSNGDGTLKQGFKVKLPPKLMRQMKKKIKDKK